MNKQDQEVMQTQDIKRRLFEESQDDVDSLLYKAAIEIESFEIKYELMAIALSELKVDVWNGNGCPRMQEIIDWVTTNINKTDEEIMRTINNYFTGDYVNE